MRSTIGAIRTPLDAIESGASGRDPQVIIGRVDGDQSDPADAIGFQPRHQFGHHTRTNTLPPKPQRVPYKTNINRSAHDLNRPIVITPEAPVFTYNPELIELYKMKDTIEVKANFNF